MTRKIVTRYVMTTGLWEADEEFTSDPDDVLKYAKAAYQIADAMLREREKT